tara:strand:- start:3158 stop:4927 length:1770 start_codon:yes stop_codon:yes gene_type:complete
MQNKNASKSLLFTLFYFFLSIFLFFHTYYGQAVIFDRTFRSMHVVPKSMTNHAPGYWTFDWLTHPFRSVDGMTGEASVENTNVVPALCMHEIDECFKWNSADTFPTVDAACQASSHNQKKGKFSCAMTRNQTRYAAGLYNSHCATLSTKFEKVACQMQRTADVDLVVNDDKSFSMSSGHSRAVLMFYVSVILFVVNIFNFFESGYWMKPSGNFEYTESKDVQDLKKYFAIVVFVILIFHRTFYATEAQRMGIQAPVPNGTFFYGLLAYAAVTWFLCYHEVDESSDGTSVASAEVTPLAPGETAKSMELNLAGFESNNKLKMNAFLQPGAVPNLERPTDGDADLTLKNVELRHYGKRPSNSVWAMVNLWVWPLIILSAFITKSNYQLDIELTVVLVGFFFVGLIELFTKRLLEVKYLFTSVQESSDSLPVNSSGKKKKDASLQYGVSLVVFVSMIVQITTIAVLFWTANWSYSFFWQSSYKDSGVFTIGDPEKSNRVTYIQTVKTTYVVYFFLVQLYKIASTSGIYFLVNGELKKTWYLNMDGFLFFLLNLGMVAVFVTYIVQADGILYEKEIGYYDVGVYLKAVASDIS